MRSKYMYSLTRAMLNSAISDVGGARLLQLTIRLNPLIWYDRLAKREVFFFFLWIGRIERGLHAIIVRIELEMGINFAQVYLHNG